MSLRCLRQRNNHVFGTGFNPPFQTVRTAALRHGSSDRNASSSSTRTALSKFDWVFWGAYTPTGLESSIASVKSGYSRSGAQQLHSNYVIVQQIGGQLSNCGDITRSGTTVTVNTENDLGVAHAPDSNFAVGRSFSIINAAVTAYNGTWMCTAVNATSIEFTASGAAATAANDTSQQGIAFSSTAASGDIYAKMGEMPGWWVWKTGTSGRRYSGISGFNAFEVNTTTYAPTDSNGDRAPQWRAKAESARLDSFVDGLDFKYVDNYLDTRPDQINGASNTTKLDIKQTGVQQDINDTDIKSATRSGHAAFADAIRLASLGRTKSPNQLVIGNHDSNLPGEYAQSLDAVFLEGVTGRSWSDDTQTGFTAAFNYYAGVRQGLKDPVNGIVVFCALLTTKSQGRDGGPNDYSRARYSYCMSQLIGQPSNTYLLIKADDDDAGAFRYDEYNAQLGNPVEPDQTGPRFGATGWGRKFQNGIVIVNSSHTSSLTIDLTGQGYKRLNAASYGNQNPTVNNGQPVTGSVTIGPWDGIVLIKE